MDLLNLLAQEATTNGPSLADHWQAISAIVGTILTAAGTGLTALWKHWVKKEAEEAARWEKHITDLKEAHGESLKELKAECAKNVANLKEAGEKRITTYKGVVDQKDELIKEKDGKIEELSKELSKKSDELAEKIEQLQGITLEKVVSYGDKFVDLNNKTTEAMTMFSAAVSKLNIEPHP